MYVLNCIAYSLFYTEQNRVGTRSHNFYFVIKLIFYVFMQIDILCI